jgi:prepilin peptidase CpaA
MSAIQSFLVAAAIVTAIAAWIDYRTGHIPNWLTLGPLAAAPLAHAAVAFAMGRQSAALDALGLSLLGALVCGLVPLLLFRVDAIGGGDVKLLAAVGALCGPLLGIEAELYGFLTAAALAPARLAYEGKLLRVLGNTAAIAMNPLLPRGKRREISPEMLTKIRFGPAIFAGVLVAVILQWRPL